jgi:rhodanese-related sulfurtransferase
MRKLLFSSLLASSVALGALSAGAGCSKDQGAGTRVPARVATVSIDELDRMLASNECQAVDANGDMTRQKMGIIPGAVLLTDADSIDKLPADRSRNLVFYCANTACGASHHAAAKAMMAGYTHVKVLPDGIAGWVKAGKKTLSI